MIPLKKEKRHLCQVERGNCGRQHTQNMEDEEVEEGGKVPAKDKTRRDGANLLSGCSVLGTLSLASDGRTDDGMAVKI